MRSLLLLLILAPPLSSVSAGHDAGCVPDQEATLVFVDSTPTQPIVGRGFYLDVRFPPNGPPFDLWIFEETNGLAGLQRDDEVIRSETCGHEADTIIF